ncbi:MAG: hypothetical protein AEth_01455 [Candidatus Argoarchaeum ethanivorans]|uniref:Uncharacterized protein n=1 Tax=Candidatus Argoarchaeum ethanivorans TaxID=2608793 RepID=A0A8B3S1T3_9EURY|nr:MAG: hypothetical protein AEth_01455 [Candidatus Argoarchaeum ethanivorans]
MNKKQISIIAVIALLFLVGLYSLTPETRRVAVSVPYQEAIYETFYSGTLKDTGLSTRTWTISRATSYDKEYTGKDAWGSSEYTFKVCWGVQCTNYPEINAWNIQPKRELAGYETRYKTEYKYLTKTKLEWIFS